MIQVTFEEDRENRVLVLRMRGHAGHAPEGQDVVCAAASILAYTAAQIASDMFADGKLRRKPCIRLERGDAVVSLRPTEAYYDEALYALYVTQVGYYLLAKNYPTSVRLSAFGQPSEF